MTMGASTVPVEDDGCKAREAARASCSWRRKAKSRSESMASAAVSSRRCSDKRECKSLTGQDVVVEGVSQVI